MLRLLLAVPLLAALAVGCDTATDADQAAFETQAFFSPSTGIADDDWRVAPVYDARVQVQSPPQPNPAFARETVEMLLYADAAPGGLALYRVEADGRLGLIDTAAGQTGPSFYTFAFFGSEVSPLGRAGFYRLVVLDGRDRVVTFGDVELRG